MFEQQTNKNKAANKSVLITGGSGLIGRYLTSSLLSAGYNVSHLSRNLSRINCVKVYKWDPQKEFIDPEAFNNIDYVVHLAGANIGEKRWSKKRKEEIRSSRIGSARLLYNKVCGNKTKLKAFISASAVGFYGSVTSDHIFNEDDPPAKDFLGVTCKQWEESADQFTESGIRTVKIRTAMVLEKTDSALTKLLKVARIGIFPVLGNGNQYLPWIHIDDLCNIYLKAITDDRIEGTFNAVAPQHVSQKEFMHYLATAMSRTFFHPRIPAFIMNLAMGRMADVILKGSRISSERIIISGYRFIHKDLYESLVKTI